jgi:ATP-dependent RNA helicase DHX57
LLEDEHLIKSLSSYGFKETDIRSALESLSSGSDFSSTLLSTMSLLEASLEYLLLYTPETDLPKSFKVATSTPFVSSVHSGRESLAQRWVEERAVKEAGYPRRSVKEAFKHVGEKNLESVFEALACKLIGLPIRNDLGHVSFDQDARDVAREGEIEAVQAVYPNAVFAEDTFTLSIPLAPAPATMHFLYPSTHPYPESTCLPPFYISSDTLPAYMRLHLTSKVAGGIERFESEGCCFNAIELANNSWEQLEEQGWPRPEDVIKNLLPPALPRGPKPPEDELFITSNKAPRVRKMDNRSNEQVLHDFERVRASTPYREVEEQRKRLPAWEHRRQIVDAVEKNPVVIMVGETGKFVLRTFNSFD